MELASPADSDASASERHESLTRPLERKHPLLGSRVASPRILTVIRPPSFSLGTLFWCSEQCHQRHGQPLNPDHEVVFPQGDHPARSVLLSQVGAVNEQHREGSMENLKEKTIRGGVARLSAQGANFFLRLGALMVLARLLGPKDFGLVGMVTAFTGVLTLFRDFGLSAAAIQRATVTEEQMSTLFWFNILVGALLALLGIGMAPAYRCLLPRAPTGYW